MAQIRNPLDEIRLPFAKMTFSPDVPSTALGPNEYNDGQNVETDVRGIRSMSGDQAIIDALPAGSGAPTFVTGGFRADGNFWFVVATTAVGAQPGRYYAWDATNQTWDNITPTDTGFDASGYAQNTNITEAWNGNVLFLNDEHNPPLVWLDTPGAILTMYSNVVPIDVDDIVPNGVSTTSKIVSFSGVIEVTGSSITGTTLTIGSIASNTPPITVGQYISGGGIAAGTKIVSNIAGTGDGSTWTVNISQTTGTLGTSYITNWNGAPFAVGGSVVITNANPRYYNGTWPVTACDVTTVTITCDITDAYGSGASVAPLYAWNYDPNWSGVYAKFMRLYNTPNVGSILVAGNLTATNVKTSDTELYPVTVQWSQSFGLNQAPITWQPTVTNVANQLEVPLRGPALDAFPCNGQFFLCSYWDTVVFSPINYSTTSAPILGVRQYNQGRGLLSSNCWANTDKLVYGVDARDIWVFDGQDFQGLGNQRVKNWFYDQLDPRYYDRVFMEVNSQRSQVEIYYTARNKTVDDGVPNKMISYRYDLDCWNAPRDVSDATFSCESPIWQYDNPDWVAELGSRTVVYARGIAESQLIQKDQGYKFLTSNVNPNGNIASTFRRDNIKLLKDYSGKLMVHRILPEVVNLGADPFTEYDERPIDPADPAYTANKGNITVTIEGANSVGSAPAAKTPVTIPVDADGSASKNPWAQINQNAFRVNSIELTNTSNTSVWMCSATTWQITQVEDDR
jgi:hypothetical protein